MKLHPKLKAAFTPIFTAHPGASLKRMCKLSDVKIQHLFPEDNRRCVLAALKGNCTYATCRNKYEFTVTDAEADHIIKLLQPVITKPDKLSKVSP